MPANVSELKTIEQQIKAQLVIFTRADIQSILVPGYFLKITFYMLYFCEPANQFIGSHSIAVSSTLAWNERAGSHSQAETETYCKVYR